MAKKGSKTKGKEGQSLRYQATSLADRRTRIERHMKNHPTDAQAKVALNDIKVRGGRKSKAKSKSLIEYASMEIKIKGDDGSSHTERRTITVRVTREYIETKAMLRRAARDLAYRKGTAKSKAA